MRLFDGCGFQCFEMALGLSVVPVQLLVQLFETALGLDGWLALLWLMWLFDDCRFQCFETALGLLLASVPGGWEGDKDTA